MSNQNSLLNTRHQDSALPDRRRPGTGQSALRLLFGVDGVVRILGAVLVAGIAITSENATFGDFSAVVLVAAGVVVVLSGLLAAGLAVGVLRIEKGLVSLIGADVVVALAGIAVLIAGFCSLPVSGILAVTGLIAFTVVMAMVQSALAALPTE
ncbi:hypothetical protein [Nocardia asteroides]|uniref:hypothetical protein n=1 Tax=Nocardia asteroides TaxID=1824 RepID=UPI001E5EAC70|nr:hypothetical protein [Nocardia asteroides]UGT62741.1 hypothetical protein LTT61_05205 [Nocardia asteroides]